MSRIDVLHSTVLKGIVRKRTVRERTVHGVEKPDAEMWRSQALSVSINLELLIFTNYN